MKKNKGTAIFVISTLLIILLGVVSYQAITLNDKWAWSIDFEDKNNTINSYGSLAAAIVAMLSTILLVYTILTQLEQFNKQKKQFNKQIKIQQIQFQSQFNLQKDQFEIEKKQAEYEEKKDMYFKLKLVDVFLISFIKHLETMASEILVCFSFEKENPLLHVHLYFDVNGDIERLNKMESLSLFKSFQNFFEDNDDKWILDFTDLFGLLSFYDNLLIELMSNNKAHVKEKYDEKVLLSFEINKIMNLAKTISLRFRKNENFRELRYYSSIEDLMRKYHLYLKKLDIKESDFNIISQEILFPFLEDVKDIFINPDLDEYGIMELCQAISDIRKRIYFIRTTSSIYSTNMEKRYYEYFNGESKHIKRLNEIQKNLREKIISLNLKKL